MPRLVARRGVRLIATLVVLGALIGGALRASWVPADRLVAGGGIAAATAAQERAFGAEPIVTVVRGPLSRTLRAESLAALAAFERRLARLDGVRSVSGPATFLQASVTQAEQVVGAGLAGPLARANRAAESARSRAEKAGRSPANAVLAGEEARLKALGSRAESFRALLAQFGSSGVPALGNRAFVDTVVFGMGTTPKPRFRWVFPDVDHALVLVRPEAGLDAAAVLGLGDRIRALAARTEVPGAALRTGGSPLVAARATEAAPGELVRTAPAALLVLVLIVVIASRRVGPAAALLASAAAAAGGGALLGCLLGLGLTVATAAAIPVVIAVATGHGLLLRAAAAGA
ncbi:hypothetical protein AB0L40_00350, partial [Patulibacter sp. NPDC049589]|uniref:hypothetical protein n=1 Tax=Patulibacter sp. NPDC049589 TaxID=3154731 RepID=UPI0034228267